MSLSKFSSNIDQKEVEKASKYLRNAPCDVDEEIIGERGLTETSLLMYEVNKMFMHITKNLGRFSAGLSGIEASRKTSFIKKIVHSGRIDNPTHLKRVSHITHPHIEDKNCDLNIVDKYALSMPGKGKIVLFDRGISNIATLKAMGYVDQNEYDQSIEQLHTALKEWPLLGYIMQEYFFCMSQENQKIRLIKERKQDPTKIHKFSKSDEKALGLYDEILQEYANLVDIYYDLGIPFNVVKTDDKHEAFRNWLRAMLQNLDYEKKSKKIDFAPDSTIVIATRDEVKAVLETKNK